MYLPEEKMVSIDDEEGNKDKEEEREKK